jgi:TPR repeat protein
MARSVGILIISVAFVLACVSSSHAGGDEHDAGVTRCDALAAHPDDPDRTGPGVYWEDMIEDSIAACREALAQHPDDARLLYQLSRAVEHFGDWDEAVALLGRAAELGYAQAQWSLGDAQYRVGSPIRSDEDAVRWFRRAAAQGHGPALYDLAWAYRDGRGVHYDRGAAYALILIAAETGYAPAQHSAAVGNVAIPTSLNPEPIYMLSDEESDRLLRLAAEQGYEPAVRALAILGEREP